MFIALVHFGWTGLLILLSVVELSVWMGVGGCVCPISSRMLLISTPLCELRYSAWSSTSATALMISEMVRMVPLLGGNCWLMER